MTQINRADLQTLLTNLNGDLSAIDNELFDFIVDSQMTYKQAQSFVDMLEPLISDIRNSAEAEAEQRIEEAEAATSDTEDALETAYGDLDATEQDLFEAEEALGFIHSAADDLIEMFDEFDETTEIPAGFMGLVYQIRDKSGNTY